MQKGRRLLRVGGHRGPARPRGRHRADSRPSSRGASDRVAGQPGGNAGSDRTNEEVVGIRRPLPASIFGCGGSQPAEFGVCLGGSLRSRELILFWLPPIFMRLPIGSFLACAIERSAITSRCSHAILLDVDGGTRTARYAPSFVATGGLGPVLDRRIAIYFPVPNPTGRVSRLTPGRRASEAPAPCDEDARSIS